MAAEARGIYTSSTSDAPPGDDSQSAPGGAPPFLTSSSSPRRTGTFMSEIGTPRDEALAVALAAGHSIQTAATLANMSARTARRKMADPDYRARVEAIQKRRLTKVCRMLNKAALKATEKLVRLGC